MLILSEAEFDRLVAFVRDDRPRRGYSDTPQWPQKLPPRIAVGRQMKAPPQLQQCDDEKFAVASYWSRLFQGALMVG
jgi:hypothetical protein